VSSNSHSHVIEAAKISPCYSFETNAISARTTERPFDTLDGGIGAQAHGANLAHSKQGGTLAGSTNGINPIRVEICAVCTVPLLLPRFRAKLSW
jgi:hypothetical protein